MPSRSWQLHRQRSVLLPILLGTALFLGARDASALDRVARLHSTTHSAGSAAPLRAAESRKSSSKRKSSEESSSRGATRSTRSSAKSSKTQPSTTKGHARDARRKGREPQIIDDPIIQHRADGRTPRRGSAKGREFAEVRGGRESKRVSRGRVYERYDVPRLSAHSRRESVEQPRPIVLARNAAPVRPFAPSRSATASPSAFLATGQSHPEEDGDILDVATAVDPLRADRARTPSVVIRSQPVPGAELSANDGTGASRALAQPRVVTGFGADMAPAPSTMRTAAIAGGTPDMSPDADAARQLGLNQDSSPRALAESAEQPMVLPEYTRGGRLIMPAPLKGSHEILVHQNTMADRDGLERIQNDRELDRMRELHLLVGFPEVASLRVNPTLPENRRYARPWTVKFVTDTARAFYTQFGEPLFVTSAVRTVSYQLRLQRVNGNAAAVDGDGASPHLTGQAIDFAKRNLTAEELAWMRTYLAPLIESGKIDVEEEFQQACFHVSVYRAYAPVPRRRNVQVAQLQSEPKSATAAPRGGEDLNDR